MGTFDDIISGIEQGLDEGEQAVANVVSSAGNTVEGGVEDLYHSIFGGGSSSGGGSVDTGSDVALTDIRWEGMSNQQLAQVVDQLSQGPGAGAMQQAADVLAGIAQALGSMDDTLRQQLQAIGVSWQSDAGSLAQQMSKTAADYAGAAGDSSSAASGGISQTGEGYAKAKNSVAPAPKLNGPSSSSLTDNVVHTLTGITTDHAQQAAQTDAARAQTIDGLRDYAVGAQGAINSYSAPPLPPNLGLSATAVDTSLGHMTPVGGQALGSAPIVGGGSPAVGGNVGAPGVPGTPGSIPVPPQVGGGTGGPLLPGPVSGVGPSPTPGTTGGIAPATVANYEAGIEDAGVASVVAGGGTAAGVIDARDGVRSGGRSGPTQQNKDVFADDPEFQDVPGAPAEPTAPVGKPLVSLREVAGAAEAEAAERYGVTVPRAEPEFLQPATGGRPGGDDDTHSSRYVQGKDLFGDDRLVTPAVIGDRQRGPAPAGEPGGVAEAADRTTADRSTADQSTADRSTADRSAVDAADDDQGGDPRDEGHARTGSDE